MYLWFALSREKFFIDACEPPPTSWCCYFFLSLNYWNLIDPLEWCTEDNSSVLVANWSNTKCFAGTFQSTNVSVLPGVDILRLQRGSCMNASQSDPKQLRIINVHPSSGYVLLPQMLCFMETYYDKSSGVIAAPALILSDLGVMNHWAILHLFLFNVLRKWKDGTLFAVKIRETTNLQYHGRLMKQFGIFITIVFFKLLLICSRIIFTWSDAELRLPWERPPATVLWSP